VQLVRQQHRLRLNAAMRAGLGLGLAGVALLAGAVTPSAQASVRCKHSGAPDHVLRIAPYEDERVDLDFASATVRRQGARIVVLGDEFDERGRRLPTDCAGPWATVTNTDTILFLQSGLSFATLDLAGGLPAPGLTAEADGSNEIETVFRARRGSLAYGIVFGSDAADNWRIAGSRGEAGVFLDPTRPEEPDVTYPGPGIPVVTADPRDGNDRVDATGLEDPGALTILDGSQGNDVLVGSRFRDSLEGGKGRDLLDAGAGSDEVLAREGDPDRIRCGSGNDRVVIGKGDRLSDCERIRGPKL
jgi:RTX calcium-binding nonapeptide repeat (4 copies)